MSRSMFAIIVFAGMVESAYADCTVPTPLLTPPPPCGPAVVQQFGTPEACSAARGVQVRLGIFPRLRERFQHARERRGASVR
jgi:hypothetical protein